MPSGSSSSLGQLAGGVPGRQRSGLAKWNWKLGPKENGGKKLVRYGNKPTGAKVSLCSSRLVMLPSKSSPNSIVPLTFGGGIGGW